MGFELLRNISKTIEFWFCERIKLPQHNYYDYIES